MIENRPGAVNVERRSEFLRSARERDLFAIEFALAVMKRMHLDFTKPRLPWTGEPGGIPPEPRIFFYCRYGASAATRPRVNKSFRNGFNATVALTILVSLHRTASAGAAAAAARPQLDEVIAVATSANPRGTAVRASSDAINAIRLLGKWTTASADDEAKIAGVLEELLEFDDPPIRRAAAGSLGRRGHSEILPRLVTLFAFDPRLFTQFYTFAPEARTPAPPVNLLLAALRSDQWQVRDDSLTVVTRYKVAGLREE